MDNRAIESTIGIALLTGVSVILLIGAAFGANAIYEAAGTDSPDEAAQSRVRGDGLHELSMTTGSVPVDGSYISMIVDGAQVRAPLSWYADRGYISDPWRVGEWLCLAGPAPQCFLQDGNVVSATINPSDNAPLRLGFLSASNAAHNSNVISIGSVRASAFIDDDGTIVTQTDIQVYGHIIGTEITSNGNDVPVSVRFTSNDGAAWVDPWNGAAVQRGWVHDFGVLPAGSKLGAEGSAACCYTWNSISASPYVKVLRNGDPVPTTPAYADQVPISGLLGPYAAGGIIQLKSNEYIVLFELGTTNLNSAAADFQDLIVVFTLGPQELPPVPAATMRVCHAGQTMVVTPQEYIQHISHGDTGGDCASWVVCHNGQTKAVKDFKQFATHLGHGDRSGPC